MNTYPLGDCVVIAGGSGSFGRAFIRTALRRNLTARVVSISRNAEMRYRLEHEFADPRLVVVPGDVRSQADLQAAYAAPIATVIIASAEKHIGTGQTHAHYVRSINVDGAENVAHWARARGATRIVALSTDKACDPVNAYGQSKAEMERRLVALSTPACRVSLVRYGNVVGSSGSVIPLFIRQRATGTVTVTDRRMTRYWMALADDAAIRVYQEPDRQPTRSAVGLVLDAIASMRGGEIFVPQIASASVDHVARAIAPAAQLVEIGIRDGEKLHEDLLSAAESTRTWDRGDGLYVILPRAEDVLDWPGARRVPVGFRYTSADHPQPVVFDEEVACVSS